MANASNFTAGVVATKGELRDLKSAFIASQTPVEKFSTQIAHLEALAAKFPDKAGPLRAQIANLRSEMSKAAFAGTALGKAWNSITPTIDVGNLAFRAGHAALSLFRKGLDSVIDRVGELRDQSKKAEGLGMSLSDLVGLSEAAESLSGVGGDAFQGALSKFGPKIGEAAMTGKGTTADSLKRLGLDAGALSGMGVKDQLLTVADALQKVENVNERMALSKGILGKGGEELATFLAAGGDEIRRIADEGERVAGLQFVNTAEIEQAWQAMDQLGDTLGGVLNVMASEFAPLITEISDDLSGMLAPGEQLRGIIQGLANVTTEWLHGVESIANSSLWTRLAQEFPDTAEFFSSLSMGNRYGTSGEFGATGHTDASGKFTPYAGMPGTQSAITAKVDQAAADKAEKAASDFRAMEIKAELDLASAVEFANAKKAKEIKDIGEAFTKMMDAVNVDIANKGESIADSLKNPAEQLRDKFEEFQDSLRQGGIGKGTFLEGLADLRSKARDLSLTDTGPRTVGAIRGGSVEALRQEFSQKNNTEKQLEEQKKLNETQQDAKALLQDIKAALTGDGGFGEAT